MNAIGRLKEYMASKPLDSRVFMIVLAVGSVTAIFFCYIYYHRGRGSRGFIINSRCSTYAYRYKCDSICF